MVILNILRTFFNKRDDGVWQIFSMCSVDLNPEVEGQTEFYKVQNSLIQSQPNINGPMSAILGRSIVPIVARDFESGFLRAIGTGFFISCSGLLLTAAHVVTDPIERSYGDVKEVEEKIYVSEKLELGVMLPLNPYNEGEGFLFVKIEWAAFMANKTESPLPFAGVDLKLQIDLAICKVTELNSNFPFQPLALVQPGLKGIGMQVDKEAFALGYGNMNDVAFEDGKSTADFNFDLHVSKGKITHRFPNNIKDKSASTPGPCFQTNGIYPGGMSGSPIFDEEGIYVHGVVSKGVEGENGPEPLGFGSMIYPALNVPIKGRNGKTLLELMEDGEDGMARVSIPDA